MKTKIIKGESYKVIAPSTSHGLSVGFCVTLEAAVERTLDSQKRAVEKGYNAERWLIVKNTWSRTFDSKGEFLRESEHSEVVAKVNDDGTVEYKI